MGQDPQQQDLAARLRGFGPLGIAAVVLVLGGNLIFAGLSAIGVLLWAWLAEIPLADLGLKTPRNWVGTIALGAAFGIALKVAMKAVVMPLLGGPAINPAYHFIAGNTAVLPAIILTMIFVGGIGEEILYRGFLFERLRRLLGESRVATAAIVVGTTLLFAAAHIPEQHLAGAQQALFVGFAYAMMYLLSGTLWLGICAHAAFDLTAVAMIYFNLEASIAHSIFG